MTKVRTKKRRLHRPSSAPGKRIQIAQHREETKGEALAGALLGETLRHAHAALDFGKDLLSAEVKPPTVIDASIFMANRANKAAVGELTFVTRMLASQATTLDCMFTELARRAHLNLGQFPQASDTYARLALKAQSNCRTTLETLNKLHQPREQTVRHVHINEGGQAVVADHFHAGGSQNAKAVEQSHATDALGASAALPSPDPQGNGVPIPSRKRQAAMQDARRDQSGRSEGQS